MVVLIFIFISSFTATLPLGNSVKLPAFCQRWDLGTKHQKLNAIVQYKKCSLIQNTPNTNAGARHTLASCPWYSVRIPDGRYQITTHNLMSKRVECSYMLQALSILA